MNDIGQIYVQRCDTNLTHCYIRHFQEHTKLEIIALIPALYCHMFSSLFCSQDVGKCEIRCQLVKGIAFQRWRIYWSFKF